MSGVAAVNDLLHRIGLAITRMRGGKDRGLVVVAEDPLPLTAVPIKTPFATIATTATTRKHGGNVRKRPLDRLRMEDTELRPTTEDTTTIAEAAIIACTAWAMCKGVRAKPFMGIDEEATMGKWSSKRMADPFSQPSKYGKVPIIRLVRCGSTVKMAIVIPFKDSLPIPTILTSLPVLCTSRTMVPWSFRWRLK